MLTSQHAESLADINEFISTADDRLTSIITNFSVTWPIPAGCIIGTTLRVIDRTLHHTDRTKTGSETSGLFYALSKSFSLESTTPTLHARISSRESVNLKTILRCTVGRVIASGRFLETTEKRKKTSVLSRDDMKLLEVWYKTKFQTERNDEGKFSCSARTHVTLKWNV